MSVIIGLTGAIATGKSTVSQMLKAYDIPIIEADHIARKVVEPGTIGLDLIKRHFGKQFISDGKLNRKKLGSVIFSDQDKREKLNQLLHPLIEKEMDDQINELKQKNESLIVLDIPLLFETDFIKKVDQIMVVYTPESVQIERLMTRDQLTKEQAMDRISSQIRIEDKRDQANILIDNSGSLAKTQQQVNNWLKTELYIR